MYSSKLAFPCVLLGEGPLYCVTTEMGELGGGLGWPQVAERPSGAQSQAPPRWSPGSRGSED